jgi:hypothetical protein
MDVRRDLDLMAVDNPLEVLLDRRPAKQTRGPVTARVVRSDASGVWCTPLGGDVRHPIGPCRGATRRAFTAADGTGHRHDSVEQLPVGMVVLLVFTDERPWVAAWEEA